MQRTELSLRGRVVPLSVGFLESVESLVQLLVIFVRVDDDENGEGYCCGSYGECDYAGGAHCGID